MITYIVNTALPLNDPHRKITIRGYQASSYSESPSHPDFTSVSIPGRSSPLAYFNSGSARTVSFSMLFHKDMIGSSGFGYPYPTINNSSNSSSNNSYIGIYASSQTSNLTNSELSSLAEKVSWTNYQGVGGTLDREGWSTKYRELLQVQSGDIESASKFHQFINQLRALNYPEFTKNGIVPPKVFLRIGDGMSPSNRLGSIQLKGYCTTSIEYTGETKFDSLVAATVSFEFTEVLDQSWSATEVVNGMMRYANFDGNGEWMTN